jgi:hypothetical protein
VESTHTLILRGLSPLSAHDNRDANEVEAFIQKLQIDPLSDVLREDFSKRYL